MTLRTFLKVDKLTLVYSHGNFGHICMELDLKTPLASVFKRMYKRICLLHLYFKLNNHN